MTSLFTNIFGSGGSPLNQYYKTEKVIAGQFSKTGVLMRAYQKAQTGFERETRNLEDFVSKNANVQIAEDTVENRVFEKRLRRRKGFTIGADVLVSIPSVKLVMGETLGTGLTTPVALTVGLVFSYFLLKLAIGYKIDDKLNGESGFVQFWKRYSYIIPLALIPVLSLFLITQSPGSPANFIWIVFLAIALLLNLKAASYSKQYQMMENTAEARKERTKLEKSIEGQRNIIEEVNDKMSRHMHKIEMTAIDLKRKWLDIPEAERPKQILLNPRYIFVLNNRIYYTQLLPYPPLEIQTPTGPVGEYHEFWANTTGAMHPMNNQADENSEDTSAINQSVANRAEQSEEPTEVEDAPSFGVTIDPSNKYV